ncbi:MAG: flagellar basal body P-ring protein FlgI [Oligoflexales bacterium]|nr:flagellar basal body P-ring protein FlgI [Oligoflexales bacterium]
MKKNSLIAIVVTLMGVFSHYDFAAGQRARLKDLTNIKGVRSNKLIGYGVVFGLAGTGDSAASITSLETVSQMLTKLGVKSKPEQLASGNFASVLVTAELPPFARSGDRLDIRVSTNGDATSLAGGTLLLSELRAGDGKVYVVAQGPVVIGQANGVGASVLTVATVPMGGLVEREFRPQLAPGGSLILSLKKADFTTNARISHAVNAHFRGFYAKSLDPASIRVEVPPQFKSRLVEFVAELESLKVALDRKAVVVLNERTGTVVIGNDVTLGPVTIAHGDLSIKVKDPEDEEAEEKDHSLLNLPKATVGGLVKSLNELGVKPQDLIGILQAIHAAGALQGEIVFI